jgi:hypothetical protein
MVVLLFEHAKHSVDGSKGYHPLADKNNGNKFYMLP